jgi:hypothetical protein
MPSRHAPHRATQPLALMTILLRIRLQFVDMNICFFLFISLHYLSSLRRTQIKSSRAAFTMLDICDIYAFHHLYSLSLHCSCMLFKIFVLSSSISSLCFKTYVFSLALIACCCGTCVNYCVCYCSLFTNSNTKL